MIKASSGGSRPHLNLEDHESSRGSQRRGARAHRLHASGGLRQPTPEVQGLDQLAGSLTTFGVTTSAGGWTYFGIRVPLPLLCV